MSNSHPSRDAIPMGDFAQGDGHCERSRTVYFHLNFLYISNLTTGIQNLFCGLPG